MSFNVGSTEKSGRYSAVLYIPHRPIGHEASLQHRTINLGLRPTLQYKQNKQYQKIG